MLKLTEFVQNVFGHAGFVSGDVGDPTTSHRRIEEIGFHHHVIKKFNR